MSNIKYLLCFLLSYTSLQCTDGQSPSSSPIDSITSTAPSFSSSNATIASSSNATILFTKLSTSPSLIPSMSSIHKTNASISSGPSLTPNASRIPTAQSSSSSTRSLNPTRIPTRIISNNNPSSAAFSPENDIPNDKSPPSSISGVQIYYYFYYAFVAFSGICFCAGGVWLYQWRKTRLIFTGATGGYGDEETVMEGSQSPNGVPGI
mmetsp:Transcript_46736/g.69127  ORF Transcript_46736/g.69127 Transcript_46736/m.69127 type:complete len:207 (+) Transcript_46736:98-718(+)